MKTYAERNEVRDNVMERVGNLCDMYEEEIIDKLKDEISELEDDLSDRDTEIENLKDEIEELEKEVLK